ncbi:NFATC2-interacting protein [Lamellibrachia satsuma]|nr:NFATC2-interacting protein [Lamellibrachia satsuma]
MASLAREVTADDSSDTDTDSNDISEPKTKRKRATRGLYDEEISDEKVAHTLQQEHEEKTSGIYLVDTQWQHEILSLDSGSDIDEEVGDVFQPHTKGRRVTAKTASVSVVPGILDLTDSDIDCAVVTTTETRALSPSPPPTLSCPARRRKQNKGIKDAFRNLERLKTIADLPEVFVVSPRKSIEPNISFVKELIVKIRSRSGIQRFTMKYTESFHNIIRAMALHEYVKENQVTLILNDISIKPYDTPTSIDLTVADIIECHILRPEDVDRCDSVKAYLDPSEPDVLSLRLQSKDTRLRSNFLIRKTEKMDRLMNEYAKERHTSVDKLAFFFDGEKISPSDTPDDLDLEDSFCVDVTGV